jgi:hypothetical protein
MAQISWTKKSLKDLSAINDYNIFGFGILCQKIYF